MLASPATRRGRSRREYRQAAGAGAPKVIRVPVPMSAFGTKADITQTSFASTLTSLSPGWCSAAWSAYWPSCSCSRGDDAQSSATL